MRVIDQAIMNRVFDVTDELGISREAVQVPLLMAGEGVVRSLPGGRFEIELPDTDDLDPFLRALPGELAGAGWTGGRRV
ncbi:MAG: hypothetical protein KDD11_15920 [Acidobacteria bacterium]|nr:hypothetical protein [Acidobacteriota bacterium]